MSPGSSSHPMETWLEAPPSSEPISYVSYVSATQESARDAAVERAERERRSVEQATRSPQVGVSSYRGGNTHHDLSSQDTAGPMRSPDNTPSAVKTTSDVDHNPRASPKQAVSKMVLPASPDDKQYTKLKVYIQRWATKVICQSIADSLNTTPNIYLLEQIQLRPLIVRQSMFQRIHSNGVVNLSKLLQMCVRRGNVPLTTEVPLFLSSIIYDSALDIARRIIWTGTHSFPAVYGAELTLTPPQKDENEFNLIQCLFPKHCRTSKPPTSFQVSAYQEEQLSGEWQSFLAEQRDSLQDIKQCIYSFTYSLYSSLFFCCIQAEVQSCLIKAQFSERVKIEGISFDEREESEMLSFKSSHGDSSMKTSLERIPWPSSSAYAALQRKPRIIVRTPWDAYGLMSRAKVDDPTALLGNLLSVTGDLNLAQAEKCRDYVSQNWPSGGLDVLTVLEQVIDKGSLLEYLEGSGRSSTEPISLRHKLAGAKDDPVNAVEIAIVLGPTEDIITFEGNKAEAELVVQIVAWLTAAFYHLDQDRAQLVVVSLVEDGAMLDIRVHSQVITGYQDQSCWLPMLETACIAHGFPIDGRKSQRGVQMSLETAAVLIGATRLTVHDGGIVVLGYAGMLLPAKLVANCIQWHFVPSTSLDAPMTYGEGIATYPDRLKIVDLSDFKEICFIGWHPEASSQIAKCCGGLNYSDIRKSGLGDPGARIRLRNTTIGFQQIATLEVNVDIVPYQSPRFYQMKKRRYESILRQLDRGRVLMYDVNTDRAWLLSAADVALHLIQYRLQDCPIPFGHRDISTLDLFGTALETLRHSAGIELEKGYTIQEMVINTWESMEYLQSEVRTQSMGEVMLSLPGRNSLLGFEYIALAQERPSFELRDVAFKGLFMKGATWLDLIQADKPLVLLGNNFGELIALGEAAQRNTCALWRRVPTGASLMAVTGEVLRHMYDEEPGAREGRSTNPSLTSQKLEWNQGSAKLFESCTTPVHSCNCQRIQGLATRKPFLPTKIVPPAEYPASGAVIFGLADRVERPASIISPTVNLPERLNERQLSKRPIATLFSRSRTTSTHIEQAMRSDSAIVMEGLETERLG